MKDRLRADGWDWTGATSIPADESARSPRERISGRGRYDLGAGLGQPVTRVSPSQALTLRKLVRSQDLRPRGSRPRLGAKRGNSGPETRILPLVYKAGLQSH
jgi:hypothetical protein